MTIQDFNQRLELIRSLKDSANKTKQELLSLLNITKNSEKEVVDVATGRDEYIDQYFSLLKEFNFSEDNTVATDVFPGIRTVTPAVDYEELRTKSETMKTAAEKIKSMSQQLSVISNKTTQDLKKILDYVTEYILLENQVYDESMETLNDLDSVYDIGNLASST